MERKTFFFGIDPEGCCDLCGETIHNHFDCPVCKKKNAGAGVYGDFNPKDYDCIRCEECDVEFKFIEGDPVFGATWESLTTTECNK